MSQTSLLETNDPQPEGINAIPSGDLNHVTLVRTILKFPRRNAEEDLANPLKRFESEVEALQILGNHERIVQYHGTHKHGILLEYMPNGPVDKYLAEHPDTTIEQRVQWAIQALEGLIHVHSKNMTFGNLSVRKLLIDRDMKLKLCGIRKNKHNLNVIPSRCMLQYVLRVV